MLIGRFKYVCCGVDIHFGTRFKSRFFLMEHWRRPGKLGNRSELFRSRSDGQAAPRKVQSKKFILVCGFPFNWATPTLSKVERNYGARSRRPKVSDNILVCCDLFHQWARCLRLGPVYAKLFVDLCFDGVVFSQNDRFFLWQPNYKILFRWMS